MNKVDNEILHKILDRHAESILENFKQHANNGSNPGSGMEGGHGAEKPATFEDTTITTFEIFSVLRTFFDKEKMRLSFTATDSEDIFVQKNCTSRLTEIYDLYYFEY